MGKGLMLLLLACIIVLPAVAYAEPPVDVLGVFTYTPTGCAEIRWAGDNEFMLDCGDTGWYEGTFAGESEEEYEVVLHGSEGNFVFEHGWYRGTVTLEEATVAGRTGTLVLEFIGTSPGDIFVWDGTWRIVSGTGGLEGLHGNGKWWTIAPLTVHYEGKMKFTGDE
jgi:hypothetical protein